MENAWKKIRLEISGMSCHHCVRAVREALSRLIGVQVHDVQIGSAEISYDPEQVPFREIRDAIEEEGYELVEGESG